MTSLTTAQAAAEIVALINSSPRSPRVDQIEAIVARAASSGRGPASPALIAAHAEWRRTVAARDTAIKAADLLPGAPGIDEAEAIRDERGRICNEARDAFIDLPILNWAELHLLSDLVLEATGELDPEAWLDEDVDDWQEIALKAVLRAIRDPDEPETDAQQCLLRDWDTALAEWHEGLRGPDESDEARKAVDDRLIAFCQEQWARPARSWDDVTVLAGICKFWNWPDYDPGASDMTFEEELSRTDALSIDTKSFAHLLKGIADVVGRPLEIKEADHG